MEVIKDFETEEEKQLTISQMEVDGYRLVEVQYYFDGKHLIFENDEPEPEPEPVRDLAAEIDEIKARLGELEGK